MGVGSVPSMVVSSGSMCWLWALIAGAGFRSARQRYSVAGVIAVVECIDPRSSQRLLELTAKPPLRVTSTVCAADETM